ncbi:MAG: YdcF family protein [Bacteroidia bacterium]|nr:YdcF family protein [Bacteroidia bacterium]
MNLPDRQQIQAALKAILKRIMIFLGAVFLFLWILSFTDIPYYAYHSLGTAGKKLQKEPGLIVLLGGSGMPSPDGFMRCYYASKAAKKHVNAKLVIALPFNEMDSLRQLKMMANELILHGVDSSRISFEPKGFNTHSQAENIAHDWEQNKSNLSVLLVTSPEHMFRALKTFQKQGFKEVGGEATFEIPPDEEKIKQKGNEGNIEVKNLSLRYNMWSYLNYELLVLREYTAIAYYWVKGWI